MVFRLQQLPVLRACASIAAAMLPACAWAQPAFPSRPVRVIVPFAPAGGTDILARSLAQRLSESFGRPVIVDNRPGANALIGTEAVAKSPPDGHTVLMTTNIFTINPWLFVPAGTPRDIVERLHSETVKALGSAEIRQRLAAQGFDAEGTTPAQFTEIIRRDLARWKTVIAKAGIAVER